MGRTSGTVQRLDKGHWRSDDLRRGARRFMIAKPEVSERKLPRHIKLNVGFDRQRIVFERERLTIEIARSAFDESTRRRPDDLVHLFLCLQQL